MDGHLAGLDSRHILEERLAMARATADHLSERLAEGWWQLDRFGARLALAARRDDLGSVHRGGGRSFGGVYSGYGEPGRI